jgi:mRNA-degrading endonuclease RelE of RelBE toxin-antitoxin system
MSKSRIVINFNTEKALQVETSPQYRKKISKYVKCLGIESVASNSLIMGVLHEYSNTYKCKILMALYSLDFEPTIKQLSELLQKDYTSIKKVLEDMQEDNSIPFNFVIIDKSFYPHRIRLGEFDIIPEHEFRYHRLKNWDKYKEEYISTTKKIEKGEKNFIESLQRQSL